jgi:probable F420-dependent oxidoreductase
MMQIGLRLPNNGPHASAGHVIASGQLAEELGFDSLWTNDHLLTPEGGPSAGPYGRLIEAFVTLAALSTVTHRVGLGTGVLILPLREPVLVAKQAAAIDVYSGGRLMLGVGVGWEAGEFGFLNLNFEQRGQRADEWLKVIRAIWQGQHIRVSTESYDISAGLSLPAPAQPGGPPILVGGQSAAALRRAAHLADGWIASSTMNRDTLMEGIKTIKAQAPAGHRGLVLAYRKPGGSLADDEIAQKMVQEINDLEQLGVQHCILTLPETSAPATFTQEVRLFAEKVLPQLSRPVQ